MQDVACEFACAVGCAETISTNVLNSLLSCVPVIEKNPGYYEHSRSVYLPVVKGEENKSTRVHTLPTNIEVGRYRIQWWTLPRFSTPY